MRQRNMNPLQPNFCQLPNVIVDDLLAAMTPAQFVCLVVIIRKTRGWHKESDAISLSQFIQLTGLKSKHTIIAALSVLDSVGLVKAERTPRRTTVYYLGKLFWCKNYTSQDSAKIAQTLSAINAQRIELARCKKRTNKRNTSKKKAAQTVHNSEPAHIEQYLKDLSDAVKK